MSLDTPIGSGDIFLHSKAVTFTCRPLNWATVKMWVDTGETWIQNRLRRGSAEEDLEQNEVCVPGRFFLPDTMILKDIQSLPLSLPLCLSLFPYTQKELFLEPFYDGAEETVLKTEEQSVVSLLQLLDWGLNECCLMPPPNGIALSWSWLLWQQLSRGGKITTKIKRQNKAHSSVRPTAWITH